MFRLSAFILAFSMLLTPLSKAQYTSEGTMKIDRVLKLVDAYYVDSVKQDKLVSDAIISILKDLDPHSVYITKEEVKEMNEPLVGNFEGIGIQFNILFDTILIIAPISGGPSEKVGLRPGDRIVKIDNENVAGVKMTTTGVRDRLLGKKGTKVKVSILRKGKNDLMDFTITRDKIPIFSLDAAYMVDDQIGYIRFNRFSATTMNEFHEAIAKMNKKGMKDVILDLRGNGGGMLDAAIHMADEFLEKEKLIVYIQGTHIPRQDFSSTSRGSLKKERVVILIDEGSASASEIVTGALQDWDRGIVVGRRSFGKGLVQKPFYLPDESMIRLTIARYYTPSGRLIQKSYKDGVDSYMKDLIERYKHGELVSADSIHFPDSLKFYTRMSHRPVYGGGGIMPDIFVPVDTSANYSYSNSLVRSGVLTSFVLDYLDEHRDQLKKEYNSFDDFKTGFRVDDSILDALNKMASDEGVKSEEEEVKSSAKHLRLIVKALIARDTWNISEYYEIVNENDDSFAKAVEVLQDKNFYNRKLK
jgi:carboxyl-terminal processing protease